MCLSLVEVELLTYNRAKFKHPVLYILSSLFVDRTAEQQFLCQHFLVLLELLPQRQNAKFLQSLGRTGDSGAGSSLNIFQMQIKLTFSYKSRHVRDYGIYCTLEHYIIILFNLANFYFYNKMKKTNIMFHWSSQTLYNQNQAVIALERYIEYFVLFIRIC
ncbi:Hypothetical_protein [Hexamita inflata]|uniref:Hypothetical_protein n=1 Tax=Hexamita inflata TaxID=28002 RepID=A0AA86RVF9_9EUKA|nr:Hypothetical protein HINF_LOCUS66249 [Hexamita inflata]